MYKPYKPLFKNKKKYGHGYTIVITL